MFDWRTDSPLTDIICPLYPRLPTLTEHVESGRPSLPSRAADLWSP
jgi:hypothetical protein